VSWFNEIILWNKIKKDINFMDMEIEVLDCIKDVALIEQYKREVVEEEYEQQHPWDSCQEGDILYIAKIGKAIVGWMKIKRNVYQPQRPPGHIVVPLRTLNMAYILNFATAKRKYKGIGTHMMQYLEKDLKEKGFHFIELTPLTSALGFYRKMGYVYFFEDQYYKWIHDDKEYEYAFELSYYKENL